MSGYLKPTFPFLTVSTFLESMGTFWKAGFWFSLLEEVFLAIFIYSESGQIGNFQTAKGRGQLRETPLKTGVIL
jgi:hypothetical protein